MWQADGETSLDGIVKTCFVIMPISRPAHSAYHSEHFSPVLDYLFRPALESAGYEVSRLARTLAATFDAGQKVAAVPPSSLGAEPRAQAPVPVAPVDPVAMFFDDLREPKATRSEVAITAEARRLILEACDSR